MHEGCPGWLQQDKTMFGMANNSLALASNDSLTIVLKRFYNNLPDKPYHSNGFDVEGLKINRKIEAVKKKYIQFNHPNWKKYILIDIDRPGAVTDWLYESPHLPAPNLIIENRKNGHAHFVYELIDAVSFTERSSLKAQNYYNAVEKALTRELGGMKDTMVWLGKTHVLRNGEHQHIAQKLIT
ncbi:replication initiation protein [Acinetobacter beijerinckii]|uniref:replication initiation protein n=1 Tax=Acinetobacter beijerinckii TaxID=262668 RepID=UPI0036146F05